MTMMMMTMMTVQSPSHPLAHCPAWMTNSMTTIRVSILQVPRIPQARLLWLLSWPS
jgi:hypothetical protein